MAGGYLLYSAPNINNMYIKNASKSEQVLISNYVSDMLTAKKQDPNADTSTLEKEIDQLVYRLYGLTEEEIKIVEQN
jgi:adenine-specific DNA-methyltransferase